MYNILSLTEKSKGGGNLRKKLAGRDTIQRSIIFPKSLYDRLSNAAERINTTTAELVRECCQDALPRIVDRETKREKRRTN